MPSNTEQSLCKPLLFSQSAMNRVSLHQGYVEAYETLSHSSKSEKFYNMRCFVMFVTAVWVLFLLKLKWPKNKSFYASRLVSAMIYHATCNQRDVT